MVTMGWEQQKTAMADTRHIEIALIVICEKKYILDQEKLHTHPLKRI